MCEVKSIKSVADLMEQNAKLDKNTRYYYRGESNIGWPLVPKLARPEFRNELQRVYKTKKLRGLEHALVQRFKRFAWHCYLAGEHRPFAGGDPTHAEWLCVAQHHGLPTLLLDWSLSPLVALYYSAGGRNPTKDEKKDGRLWYMRLKPPKKREQMTVNIEDKASHGRMKKPKGPLFLIPWAFTQRVEAQAARFTYSGYEGADVSRKLDLDQIKDSGHRPWLEIKYFKIPANKKKTIHQELDRCLIHEATLFPDLDGCAAYLSKGGRWGRLGGLSQA